MEPTDDPQLSKLLREWKVEDAPRSLDERVLGVRVPWWRFMILGSMRVPVPVVLVFTTIFLVTIAALVRQRMSPAPANHAAALVVNQAEFTPVESFQVRIIRRHYEAQ